MTDRTTGRLEGKRALVTGGAQGLGAAISGAIAREGARVLVTDRDEAGARRTAAAIVDRHGAGTAIAHRLDVTAEADWQGAIAAAVEAFGGLSVLVNNAGIVTLGSVEELSLDEWRTAMAVNADGPFLGCKHALPAMRATAAADGRGGAIVNIASISSMVAGRNLAAYSASKAALAMLTKSVALHCARDGSGIRCNSVHPTFVRTPLLGGIVGDAEDEAAIAKLARQVPIGRIGEVGDVAAAVVYLASDESAMMTGSELKLDGGLSAM